MIFQEIGVLCGPLNAISIKKLLFSGQNLTLEDLQDLTEKSISDGTKLWVFPEGSRRSENKIHNFRKDAFIAATQAQVPIIPVIFSSYKNFIDYENKTFGQGEVIVSVLPATVMQSHGIEGIIEETRERMIKKFDELNREISSKTK